MTQNDTIIEDINKILEGTKPRAMLLFEYILKREDKIIKAFGGCEKCYGKGYSTQRYGITGFDDENAVREDCELEKRLPEHKASLHITHNRHRDYYEKAEEYLEERKPYADDYATPTSKERMISTDSIWEVQWYPNTPVGFNIMYGATLEEVLQAIALSSK